MVVELGSERIICTAYGLGRRHDVHLYKHSRVHLQPETQLLADSGYQGIGKIHANSRHPYKRKRGQSLTKPEQDWNRHLASQRILCERVIGRLKVFRILSERYRNRRRRFCLRFTLIAALHNFERELFF